MTNDHLEPESISAFLDGELDAGTRSAVERHLQGCPECSATRSRLAAVSGQVASLPQVWLTADEHRDLRQAVLASRRARRVPWSARYLQWAAAGGLVLVALVAISLGFLRGTDSGGDAASEALTEAAAPTGPAFDFSSGAEVDRTVASLPEVAAGLNRYRPEDAPARRSVTSGAGSGRGSAGAASDDTTLQAPAAQPRPAAEEDSANSGAPAPQAQAPELFAGADQAPGFSNEAADACLQRVASTQTYPMVGLLAREATFQGAPVWLLVFAYSSDPEVGEPMDRWQTWIVPPAECRDLSGESLEDAALYRSLNGQT